jgi:signal transduction histidine kinase
MTIGHRLSSLRYHTWRPYALQLCKTRGLSTATVTDQVITTLAAQPRHRLTLDDLVKHGRPPLSSSSLLRSANFTLSILPSRLAQRIQALRNLPFIVVTNPHISRIHGNYMHSLSSLLPWAEREIKTVEDERAFTQVMADLVETHADTIPILARGFLESRRYIAPTEVAAFLDKHLRARIGTRLIAEQHISLHYSSQQHLEDIGQDDKSIHSVPEHMDSFIGVIDTKLCPTDVIRNCESVVGDICEFKYGIRPHVNITGVPDYTFAQIPSHLEYIITELLKNAFRATIENRMESEPIEITIAPLPESPRQAATMAGKEHTENETGYEQGPTSNIGPMAESTPGVTIRIRDRGGGISPTNYAHIWDYSFTTFNDEQIQSALSPESGGADNPMDGLNIISETDGSSLAGLGYGLPLGRAYAGYFGGDIAVQSLWGWGTDVYLSLKGVGKVEDIR